MPLSMDEAQHVIASAHAHAAQIAVVVTVVVVDEGAHLLAAARMPGAFPLSFNIAQAKAVGAALWHRDGAQLRSIQEERPTFFAQVDRLSHVPLIPGLGSALLVRSGVVLGAVGVSGATGDQDLECAQAGARTLSD